MKSPEDPSGLGFTRRRLLILGAVIAPLLAVQAWNSGLPDYVQALVTHPGTDKDTKELKTEIENQFNIAINPLGWNISQLRMVQRFLPNLPNHFYGPGVETGKQLELAMDPRSQCCSVTLRTEIVPLNPKDFDSSSPHAFEVITHELTHRLTPGLVLNPFGDSPWYHKIESILGDPFPVFAKRLFPNVKNAFDQAQVREERRHYLSRFMYGITRTDLRMGIPLIAEKPVEFVAVMGEIYVHGESFFSRFYSEFIEQQVTDGLYGFAKQDIFRGLKEYTTLPV